MTDSFSNLSLAPTLARAVAEMGYESMTPIQAQAIPVVLTGQDVMGAAQTGTGKTAAFSLPLLQRLLKQFGRPPVMGVVPTQSRLIELSLTQGDLAALLCASRQRINGVLRQLQAQGVLGGSHGRIEVLMPQKLADVASGKLVLDTSGA
jgi:CRP-like cAMP-binding protein